MFGQQNKSFGGTAFGQPTAGFGGTSTPFGGGGGGTTGFGGGGFGTTQTPASGGLFGSTTPANNSLFGGGGTSGFGGQAQNSTGFSKFIIVVQFVLKQFNM